MKDNRKSCDPTFYSISPDFQYKSCFPYGLRNPATFRAPITYESHFFHKFLLFVIFSFYNKILPGIHHSLCALLYSFLFFCLKNLIWRKRASLLIVVGLNMWIFVIMSGRGNVFRMQAPAGQAKVFRRTVQDSLSRPVLLWTYSTLDILPMLNTVQ